MKIKEEYNYNLQRFLDRQNVEYKIALNEIKKGKKKSCWMWYIFPQMVSLGNSLTSNYYGIKNIEDGIEYLKNELLKHNLIEMYTSFIKFRKC